jgi:O-antigen ligase
MISRVSSFVSYLWHPSTQHHFVFILFTAIFLWAPIWFARSFPITYELFVIYALAVLLAARYNLSLDHAAKSINLLLYGMLLYGLWVVISAAMHYWAFNSLELEAYLSVPNVTAMRNDKYWAMWTLYHTAKFYLFFPLLFLISMVIFRSSESGWNKLTWIPLIFIPCILVALYQSYVDVNFLNNRPSSSPNADWLGGLGTDMGTFRSSLMLISPLCVFTVIIAQSWWKKISYVFLAAVILWLVLLSQGRAVIIVMLLFATAVPMIGAWVHGFRSDKGRRYLYVGLVWLLVLMLLMGIAFSKFGGSMSILFGERVRVTFANILKGDLIEAAPEKIELLRQAWRLIRLSPIAGWGPGGFLRNVDRIRFVNSDPFVLVDWVPNQYLEWTADIGLLGASVTLFLYVMPLWMILRIRKKVQMREERWAVGIIFATLVILFLIFFNIGTLTLSLEGLWIFVVYLGFLISVALKYGYTLYPIKGWGWGIGALLLTTVFFAGVYETTFGSRGYRAISQEVLLYPDSQGQSRAGEKATDAIKTSIASVQASSNIFSIKVSTAALNNRLLEGLRLKIFMNDELIDDRYFFKRIENTLYYYVPSIENRDVEIKTEIHQVFKPYRSDDSNIEMTVSPPSFIKAFPEESIGFYEWGKSMVGRRFPPGLPSEPVIFNSRWTGMRATFNITDSFRKKSVIYASSRHPHLNLQPVTVDIIGDKGFIQREWFWNNRWKKIQLMPDQLKQINTLTLKVNRTWNPKLSGVSDDSRDFGVAVVLPESEEPFFLFEHLSPSRAEQ